MAAGEDWLLARIRSEDGPPVDRIIAAVRTGVADEQLLPGFRMPPVRRLADELAVAVNTVAKAYRRLEGDELLEGRGRAGTFVPAAASGLSAEVQHDIDVLIASAERAGLTSDELLARVRAALGES